LFCLPPAYPFVGLRRPAGGKPLKFMVGAAGIEPATPTMSTHRDFKDSKD
jgi:hypothetical protein